MTNQEYGIRNQNFSEAAYPKSSLFPPHFDCHPSIQLAVYNLSMLNPWNNPRHSHIGRPFWMLGLEQ
jgi:hypothetical protein